ncbi:glutamate:Na+ symporter, ESS family [Mesorhizobium albiziae]|uniref:Sodium/glutamate symporter n=1 Tax=Neomesorhizobium albiziae TaxID=335020 RepID=A0A1I3VSR8_9HYPH|nr:sodium/glutamate symporter [Mesorhizobium albiziae]GLS29151.1 sodium/glutamate symporter [Mesorhizobium albiziae]SFJ98159.1 glutamate:Na+ symporter, ESS family [Mesorhizobium albiziae]
MVQIELSELETLIVGLIALLAGTSLRRRVQLLKRVAVPNAVVGAAIVAIIVLILSSFFKIDTAFATRLRDVMLLVFFATIGLGAKLSQLRAGGRPLVILCAVTVLLIVLQNLVGVAVATAWGANPIYGLLAGGLSFIGGLGTALAWAREAEAVGIGNAQVVGVGAATLAVISGALIAGPFTGWLVQRHGLQPGSTRKDGPAPAPPERSNSAADFGLEPLFWTLLLLSIVVLVGDKLNDWARANGLIMPGFLTAMLVGVALANVADALRFRVDDLLVQKAGDIALNLFLVISLMSVKLSAVAAVLAPLAINLALQLTLALAIGYFVLFRLLGRDYDAAVSVGGFLGFGVSSMPVAMATMDEIVKKFGPAPKAFLLVTLAGAFFVDLANAVVTKAFLMFPYLASAIRAANI